MPGQTGRTGHRRGTGLALLWVLLVAVTFGGWRAGAQDATPERDDPSSGQGGAEADRPVAIRAGACAAGDLGDVVQPLTNLTAPAAEAADRGPAVVAESSFTSIPLTLDDLLDQPHAIDVRLSEEAPETGIACGEIGGPLNDNGNLVIGLKEQGGSGFAGIAFLAPSLADPEASDVSVFLAAGLADAATPVAANDAATPTAEADEEATPADDPDEATPEA